MKLHYANVFVLLIFSLICCILAMICNKENCGDNKDRTEAFNGSLGMLVVNIVWMIIVVFYIYNKSSTYFGIWYFLSIVITIISASFALQCLTSCDKISDGLKTAIQGVAGFTVPWAVVAGGVGFYYYMKSEGGTDTFKSTIEALIPNKKQQESVFSKVLERAKSFSKL